MQLYFSLGNGALAIYTIHICCRKNNKLHLFEQRNVEYLKNNEEDKMTGCNSSRYNVI